MGKVTGFLEIEREERESVPVKERVRSFKEFVRPLPPAALRDQAARCMDCGIPFCHDAAGLKGCPISNQIPDWNDLVYRDEWREASRNLHSTNNFPEFTGRICPAPCEASCTLNLTDNPVTIKSIECAIADQAFEAGWIEPMIAPRKTGKRIAIIGSGPAGLACAQQLARAGHDAHVYEKNEKPGGLLRYGIPDFKMEKHLIDRRLDQMRAEGVVFHTGAHIGETQIESLLGDYDALVLAGGAEQPRDLPIEGRELEGVHFAMDFLPQQNRRIGGEKVGADEILADSKHVIVIGGGDTGSDCIGTSIRQGALSVTQLEIMPEPPERENKLLTWPNWPLKLRTSSSQEEGAERQFSVMTQKFEAKGSAAERVSKLHCIKVDENFKPIANGEFTLKADLVLLAMGFTGARREGLLNALAIDMDERGNVFADTFTYKTSRDKVWAAGDMRRGQSLVVWAIREGRECAHEIDKVLTGHTDLPR